MDNPSSPTLVTGAQGMLGSALVARLRHLGRPVVGIDIADADLTDAVETRETILRIAPPQVIHCAAWTDVEGAEDQPEAARAVNVDAARNVALACREAGAVMTHISTDFVFDGKAAPRPYNETDEPHPLCVYAHTKLEGERAVAETLDAHRIVRTAWLYGPGGKHFVGAILRKLRETDDPLRVVADQTGSPTMALDLAEALIRLGDHPDARGIFHLANDGQTTWHGLARAIAEIDGHDPERVQPIAASEWPAKAARPAWSVLACPRAHALGIAPLRPWRQALEAYLATT